MLLLVVLVLLTQLGDQLSNQLTSLILESLCQSLDKLHAVASTSLGVRLLEVILDEDSWLIFIFFQVLLSQRDVWNYKHLEKGL